MLLNSFHAFEMVALEKAFTPQIRTSHISQIVVCFRDLKLKYLVTCTLSSGGIINLGPSPSLRSAQQVLPHRNYGIPERCFVNYNMLTIVIDRSVEK